MDSQIILSLLAASGVVTILLFVVRGLLDQLPDVFAAWHRAKKAYRANVSPVDEDGDEEGREADMRE
ncbi:hypothetical protein [Streptomyces sp. DSM 15324]|uniref:hypothetical protein n=1 Tax=Streptomyces sp. DSM 15324 TaxID=1739111 RepID=UPI00074895A3|nr:hypothetical protein [Streptomyces sp. DSM 15324]KUO10517.1 hypothetical protein AQJ58_19160 [Streptomyces sp. DSM 15324]